MAHWVTPVPTVLGQLKLCGKTGIKLRCSSCEEPTYIPFRYGSRICQHRAKYQADQLYLDVRHKIKTLEKKGGYRLRHLVLTLKSSGYWNPNDIKQMLKKLAESLPIYYRDYLRRKPLGCEERITLGLRESDLIDELSFLRKRRVLKDPQSQVTNKKGQRRTIDRTGLVGAFERGPHGNVHVHCLYYGPFRKQEEMSAIWKQVTGDSFVVRVRPIENQEKAVREITKYVVKFSEFSEERLVALCEFLEPDRRVRTYATFLGVKPDEHKESACWLCGSGASLRIEDRASRQHGGALNLPIGSAANRARYIARLILAN